MAIHVPKNMKELDAWAQKLGVQVTTSKKNGTCCKEDYINPIRDYFLEYRYGDLSSTPLHMQQILHLKSPMLAMRIDDLKPELTGEVWDSQEWYFEEKVDGIRCLIICNNGDIKMYSRHSSVEDLLPIEFSDKILYPANFDRDVLKEDFILDTEITCDESSINTVMGKYGVQTETVLQSIQAILGSSPDRAKAIQEREGIKLTFNVFDCLSYEGKWLMSEPLKHRRQLALSLYKKLSDAGFTIKPVRSNISNKKDFYLGIVRAGGEGVIAKKINGLYLPDTNRNKDGWIKIKRSMSESIAMDDEFNFGDTLDGWVSGFIPGDPAAGFADMVGAVCVSMNVRKNDGTIYEHEIARISGLDLKLRQHMTETVNGKPVLKAEYYNRVIEMDGQAVSARELRLKHAVFVGFRNDKDKDECIIDEGFLEKKIL